MRAFLSSDQVKALTEEKAIIELDVKGFGIVVVNENIKCEYCGKAGQTIMPENVIGCMYCQHLGTKHSLTFEEIEVFRLILLHVPAMLKEAKHNCYKRYGSKPQKKDNG